MTLQVSTKNRDSKPEISTQLYQHTKRPQWGLAVLVKEREGRRVFQFEDGTLRKIKKGFYNLIEPVDKPANGDVVHSALVQAVDDREQNAVVSRQTAAQPVASFEEQIALFVQLYPEGFQDPKWISEHRSPGKGNALKRHREPSLALAAESLSPEICAEFINSGNHRDLVEAVAELLTGSTLVPISHVKALRGLEGEEMRNYAEAVAHLIAEEGPFETDYRTYLLTLKRLLGKAPSWLIGTAILALTHPQEHVCVRRSAFARQAGSIAPTAKYTQKPRVTSYKNYKRVAHEVRARLTKAGHEPRDLLDVHDFVWTTLRKSALDHLGNA